MNYIQQDPFVEYRPLKERKRLVFLTQEELHKLEHHHFAQKRLETVKNIYLFSVYTGLAYHEAQALQPKHITKGFDGRNWITLVRQKGPGGFRSVAPAGRETDSLVPGIR